MAVAIVANYIQIMMKKLSQSAYPNLLKKVAKTVEYQIRKTLII